MQNNENISMNGFFKEVRGFFGLLGALPMSFTDRILQNESFDNIDTFFDEMLFLLDELPKIKHSCLIPILEEKRREHKIKRYWKVIPITRNNRIGIDRIGQFILGHEKRYIDNTSSYGIGRINSILLTSLK